MDGRPGPRRPAPFQNFRTSMAPLFLASQSPGRLGPGSVGRGRGRQSSGWQGHSAEPAVSTLEPGLAGPDSGNRLHPKSFQGPSGSAPGPPSLALEPKKAVSLSPGPRGPTFFDSGPSGSVFRGIFPGRPRPQRRQVANCLASSFLLLDCEENSFQHQQTRNRRGS